MTSPRIVRALSLAAAAVVLGGIGTTAGAEPIESQLADEANCTDDASGFDPSCAAAGTVGHQARQVCDYRWVEGCDLTGLGDPGYAVDADPSPSAKELTWRVGAVHEHSGYSDGDGGSIPRDYFRAGRTGENARGNGVKLDFVFGSEHSDNAQITVTTNAGCLSGPADAVECTHLTDNTFYWKWPAALRQANEESTDAYAAIRGFEWTNDFYNHLNVYFSTNFRNVKIDGSYLSMERMWSWLSTPVAQGGGADGLVTFNHPGSNPKLSPFDGGFPHTEVLARTGAANWNDVAYVSPEIDARVVGMEINGGEDIEFFVKALRNGWHIGPVAAEDHHATGWASTDQHKTLILTGGTTAQDYYWAFANRRTAAVHAEWIDGQQGQRAAHPVIDFRLGKHLAGSIVTVADADKKAKIRAEGLPAGVELALVTDEGGLEAPVPLGTVDEKGTLTTKVPVSTGWQFVIACKADRPGEPATPCGTDFDYSMVTAPIWIEP